MKHFLFLAVSLFIGSYSFSQKVDETLSKKYTSEELKTLKKVDSKKFELIFLSKMLVMSLMLRQEKTHQILK
jgi:hypothetical protein